MKIIYPFSYYYPETCAGIYIAEDIFNACADKDIECLVYLPTPTRNVPKEAKWNRDENLRDGKIKIHRFHMFGEGKNPVLRAFRYLLCEFMQLHYCLWTKYDLAYIDSTPPIQGLKLPIIKLFKNVPIIYKVDDVFPDSLVGAGLAKRGGILWRIGRVIENITYNNSDKIIVISEDIKNNLVNKGVPENKISVIYNWIDSQTVIPIDKNNNYLFDKYEINRDKFHVVYAGNLGNAQNLNIIIDAAKDLQNYNEIEFVIFGTGGVENEIKSRLEQEDISNVRILPLQPFKEVSYVNSIGDVCVVSCKKGMGGSAMPSKTWSIMSSGRCVLANFDEGELKNILEQNECGVFTKAGDLKSFEESILYLYKNKEICKNKGLKGRDFIIKNLTKDIQTQKYISLFKALV